MAASFSNPFLGPFCLYAKRGVLFSILRIFSRISINFRNFWKLIFRLPISAALVFRSLFLAQPSIAIDYFLSLSLAALNKVNSFFIARG